MSALAEKAWADTMATHSGADVRWGPTNVDCLLNDPKRIAFLLSRYKFAAKMMNSCRSIIDIGCGDGMGTLTFLTDTKAERVVGLDIEQRLIYHANGIFPALRAARPDAAARLKFVCGDFANPASMAVNTSPRSFDGLCCLDMIEHVDPSEGDWFMSQFAFALKDHGVAVIGTPNRLAAEYASRHSIVGHINLYSPDQFRAALERSFGRVFIFSMNDEVVSTGFDKLAHYLIGLAVK